VFAFKVAKTASASKINYQCYSKMLKMSAICVYTSSQTFSEIGSRLVDFVL